MIYISMLRISLPALTVFGKRAGVIVRNAMERFGLGDTPQRIWHGGRRRMKDV